MCLPEQIREIVDKDEHQLLYIITLLNFYKNHKKSLTIEEKHLIYTTVEKIRNFFNKERIEEKEITRNDDSKQILRFIHRSINLEIDQIYPDDLYKDFTSNFVTEN